MATGIDQYSDILAWRTPPQTEKPGRPQSKGSQRVGHDWTDPVCIDARPFFAYGVMAQSECFFFFFFFKPLVAGDQKAFLVSVSPYLHPFRHLEGSLAWGPSLLFHASGTQRGPLAGVLLCRLGPQALKGAPWVGSYSVVQGIRHLMDQPLYSSTADAGVWGERRYGDGSTLYTWLSSITLLPWLPGFLPRHFPPQSPPSHPLGLLSAVKSSPGLGIAP